MHFDSEPVTSPDMYSGDDRAYSNTDMNGHGNGHRNGHSNGIGNIHTHNDCSAHDEQNSNSTHGENTTVNEIPDSTVPHMESLFPNPSKPSLLCLHGYRSNGQITTLQLDNLSLGKNFDVHVLHGPIESDTPAETNMALLSSGPYYSWMEMDNTRSSSDGGANPLVLQRPPKTKNDEFIPNGGLPDITSSGGLRNQLKKLSMNHRNHQDKNAAQASQTTSTTHQDLDNGKGTDVNRHHQDQLEQQATAIRIPKAPRRSSMLGAMTLAIAKRTRKKSMDVMEGTPPQYSKKNSNPHCKPSRKFSSMTGGMSIPAPDTDTSQMYRQRSLSMRIPSVTHHSQLSSSMRNLGVIQPQEESDKAPNLRKLLKKRISLRSNTTCDTHTKSQSLQAQQTDFRGQFDETMAALRYLLQHLLHRIDEQKTALSDDSYSSDGEENNVVDGQKLVVAYDAVYAFSQAASLVSIISHGPMRRKLMREFGMVSPYAEGAQNEDIKPWNFAILGCAANTFAHKMVHWYFFDQHICHPILVLQNQREVAAALEAERRQHTVESGEANPTRPHLARRRSFFQNRHKEASSRLITEKVNVPTTGGADKAIACQVPKPQLEKKTHRSKSMMGAITFLPRQKKRSGSMQKRSLSGEPLIPSASAAIPLGCHTTDGVTIQEHNGTAKRGNRRASLLGVKRSFSVPQGGRQVTKASHEQYAGLVDRAAASHWFQADNAKPETDSTIEKGTCTNCGEDPNDREGAEDLIDIPCAHFIGINDDLKSESEYYLQQYKPEVVLSVYLDSGHEVPAFLDKVDALAEDVMLWRELRFQQRRRNSEASLTTVGEGSVASGGPPQAVSNFQSAPPSPKFENNLAHDSSSPRVKRHRASNSDITNLQLRSNHHRSGADVMNLSSRSDRRMPDADILGCSQRLGADDIDHSKPSGRMRRASRGSLSWIFKRPEDETDKDDVKSGSGDTEGAGRSRRVANLLSRIKPKKRIDAQEDVSLVRVNNDMIHFQQKRVKRAQVKQDAYNVDVEDKKDCPRLDSRVPYAQYFLNDIEFSEDSTLLDLLSDADDSTKPALYSVEEPAYSLSYLEILSFIRTTGDLRRVFAKKSSMVAYVPPPGAGGIISAMAFLTIVSQCTAAPIDPSYSEKDYSTAFKQLNPDIIIVFEPIDPGPVLRAASANNCACYIASPTNDGYFTYRDAATLEEMPEVDSNASIDNALVNGADGIGLLLRTSGTTSTPKVVPLKIGSIVSNARVIAKSLGLGPNDVALNAMPLFHIGGISANLLSSLAASASVILASTFDADSFLKMLITETCGVKPSWFSAVPTMHATITTAAESLSSLSPDKFEHKLKFIRSGAAALSNDLAQKMEAVFGVPVVGTYSMTEQMPITQPHNLSDIRPRSVGKPVSTSLCIVDKNLRPLPFSAVQHGELCIAGKPVFEGYQGNPSANMKSFFYIGSMKWFRTGDMGYFDKDGFLFLTGRNKEMIKRGGEQINPLEVEEICSQHPLIKMCVAFAIPDELWGQRLGLAIVLKPANSAMISEEELAQDLKRSVIEQGLQELKAPEKVLIVREEQIPMTSSRKVIRVGLADILGVKSMSDDVMERLQDLKPFPRISEALSGVRFALACAVLFNHIGQFGSLDHARFFCLHVPAFFFIGGFILAAGAKNNRITDLKSFYALRLAVIHPMYLLSLVCAGINFVLRCHPSNYIDEFETDRKPLEEEYFVCQSPIVEQSYGLAMFSSLVMHIFALQAWPFSLMVSWFILIYPWFQSVYYFCLMCFPWLHRPFHTQRRNKRGLWKLMIFFFLSNYIMVGVFRLYFPLKSKHDDAVGNIFALMSYLFPPGWIPSFALGIGAYFQFALYRPNEKLSMWKWGVITDCLTFSFFVVFMLFALLPDETTPKGIESDIDQRYFAYFLSRITGPATFLWIFGLAVGKGITARLFSNSFIVTWLAPASYNMYLFHQVVQEWYFIATRGYWFAKPKDFYWFSPFPTPIPWWEFLIVAFLTIILAVFLEVFVNGWLVGYSTRFVRWAFRLSDKKVTGKNVTDTILSVMKNITGVEVTADTNLLDTGLSSMTTLLLISDLQQIYTTLKLGARDVFGAKTVTGLVSIVEEHLKESIVATSGMDGFLMIDPDENNIRDIHLMAETENIAEIGI